MADELDLNEPSEVEKRIKQLSGKVREEAEAREKLAQEKAEAEKKASDAERRATFSEGFVDIMSTHPSAKEHKQEIQEKVMSGYSIEDATFAVLGKAGKLNAHVQEPVNPAGGSAPINIQNTTQKSFKEMNGEELRSAVEEAEKRGDLAWT